MNMQIQTQQPHKNAHISMPTEEGLEDLRQAILLARNNPKLLAFLEAEIPPHIMEELLKYSKMRVERAKREADEAEQFYKEAKSLRIQMQNLRQSIKKRMDSQQQKPTNS